MMQYTCAVLVVVVLAAAGDNYWVSAFTPNLWIPKNKKDTNTRGARVSGDQGDQW